MTSEIGFSTQQFMGQLIADALAERDIAQAEFARRTGVSPKHLNQVVTGKATAAPGMLDYWAFLLGYEWKVQLVPREGRSDGP